MDSMVQGESPSLDGLMRPPLSNICLIRLV